MKKDKLEKYLLSFKGSSSSTPFGPDALVFKVMGKMFALVSQKEDSPRITVKCLPADNIVLVSQFESIQPGYYMNKKHWITITLKGDVSSTMLSALMSDSYKLIVSKLTKRDKEILNQQK